MAYTVINSIVKNRSHLASELASDDPILLKGEFGIETDTYRVKVGDGILSWNNLPYVTDVSSATINTLTSTDIITDTLTVNNNVDLSTSPTEYYSPSSEESIGTLHMFYNSPSSVTNSSLGAGIWHEADFSNYIPVGTKALRIRFDAEVTGSSGGLFCWSLDNSETTSVAWNTGRGKLISSVTRYAFEQIIPVVDGKYYYGVYSTSWQLSILNALLMGYYI